jgi:CelD/BcsL family acetyltransferase involved in cellulose biosynthesis
MLEPTVPATQRPAPTGAALSPLVREWDELADRAGAVPWVRPGWVRAWWRAFGHGRLELVTVRRAGRLVGVVPIQRHLGAIGSPTNPHTPGFCLLATDAAARRQLAAELAGRGARRIDLCYLPPAGGGLQELAEAAAGAGYRIATRPLLRSLYTPTDGDWDAYLRRRNPHRLRGLRRLRRRLERLGSVRVDVHDGSERLEQLLTEGFAVEAAGWKGSRGTAVASQAATSAFYREVARWAAARGTLRLAFLRLDGRPLAFDFALEELGTHWLLKTGYDPAHRTCGPGLLLRFEMLARAFASEVRSYDFLGADDRWKYRWGEGAREVLAFQAFARSGPGLVDWAACTYARPAVKRAAAALRDRPTGHRP